MGWHVERLGFMYGVLLAAHSERVKAWVHRNWLRKSAVLMITSAVLGVAYLKFKSVPFFGDYLLKIVLGIAITAFVMEVISGLKVGNSVNHLLGSISYEIYLLHGVVFAGFMLVNETMNSGLFIVCSIITTVVLSIGLQKFSKGLLRRLK